MPIIGKYRESAREIAKRYQTIPSPAEPTSLQNFDFPTNADDLSDEELDNWLLRLGAWRGYISSKLADVDSQLSLIEETYELFLGIKTAQLERDAKKKLLKESLHGQAVLEDEELSQLKLETVTLRSEKQLLKGKFEFFDKQFEVISRVITRRGQEKLRS